MKRVLTIQDLSCFGKCSLTVASPILSAFGLETCVLPTAVFSTHTAPYFGNYVMTDLTDTIEPTINHWKNLDLHFDCVYIGYLCEGRQTQAVKSALDSLIEDGTMLLVDPAMGDDGALYRGLSEVHVAEMSELCHGADVITPNFTEAQFLAHTHEENCVAGAKRVIEVLQSKGYRAVVITGVNDGDKIGVIGRESIDGRFITVFNNKLSHNVHGSGDVFTGAFLGTYLTKNDFSYAVSFASEFIYKAMQLTDSNIDTHYYGVMFEPLLSGIKN